MIIRQILRKPAFMILFVLLLALSCALMCVATALWAGTMQSIREADGLFTTVAVLNEAEFRPMQSNEQKPKYAPERYEKALGAGRQSQYARFTDKRQSIMGYAQNARGVLPSDRKYTGLDFRPSFTSPYAPSVVVAECVSVDKKPESATSSAESAEYIATFEIAHEASPAIHPGYSDIVRLKMSCEHVFPDGGALFEENKTYLLYTPSMEIRARFAGASYTEAGDGTAYSYFMTVANVWSEVGVTDLYGMDWGVNAWFDSHEYDMEKREIGRKLGPEDFPLEINSPFINVMQEGALEKLPFVELKAGMGIDEVYAGKYGEMWRRIVEQCRISQHSFQVIKTDALQSLLPFNQQSVTFVSGRSFSQEEYEAGARVCAVSSDFALANGLKAGDTLEMGFYNTGYRYGEHIDGDVFYPEKYTLEAERSEETERFEIIGVYSSPGWGEDYFSFTPNTVFVPSASIPEEYPGPVPEENTLSYYNRVVAERPGMVSIILKNGYVNAFEAQMEAQGYGGMYYYFDQGYSNIAGTLSSMAGNAALLTLISGLVWLAVTALFFVLYVQRLRYELGIMALLGAGRGRKLARGFTGVALTVLAASILGSIAGTAAYDYAAEEAYAFAREQGESNFMFSELPAKSNLSQSLWEGAKEEAAVSLTEQFEMRKAPEAAALCAAVQLAVIAVAGLAVMGGVSDISPMRLLSSIGKPQKGKTGGITKLAGGTNAVSAPAIKESRTQSKGMPTLPERERKGGINTKQALQYTFRHIRRSGWRCISLMAVSLIFALLLCELQYAMQSKEDALSALYRDIEVRCVVSDLSGTQTEELMISVTHIDICTSRDYTLWEYVKDLRVKRSTPYARGETEVQAVKAGYADWAKQLTGISRRDAEPSLAPEKGIEIQYLEGYDESLFQSDEAVCIVPAKLYEEAENGALWLTIVEDLGNEEYGTAKIELTIAGIYTGVGGSEEIYCPWEIMRALTERAGGMPYTESLSFTIADNLRMDEFKQKAARYYTSASLSPGESEYNFALTVYDSILNESTTAIRRELRLLELLIPLLLVISAGAGFTASCLFIRNRKSELAVMRSLGTGKGQVFITAFTEQIFLCVPGVVLGTIGYLLLRGTAVPPGVPNLIIYMCGYLFGSGVAVARFTRARVLEILKERE